MNPPTQKFGIPKYPTSKHSDHPHLIKLKPRILFIMKFVLFITSILLLLPICAAFVVVPHKTQLRITWSPSRLQDKTTSDSEWHTYMSPSNHTTVESDVVARRTNQHLEKRGPIHSIKNFEDDNDEEDDSDIDPATQIFDPMSFWTERSGRFPRSK